MNQGYETCAVLRKSSKGGWSVIEVDEGFTNQLTSGYNHLVDDYNQQKNQLEPKN